MKNKNLTICDATIQPGETANLALPLPDYNSCISLYMPIKVVHGKEPGPCVIIFSGMEGNEFNGIEIINRLLKTIDAHSFNGSLIAVPIMNIMGLIKPGSLSYEKDFDNSFPGNNEGSFAERIAHVFTQQFLSKADYLIELKTGGLNDDILPQIYCDITNNTTKALAKKFAAPVVSHISHNNSLCNTAEDLNIPLLIYKAGEAMRFDEAAIRTGISGISNIFQELNIIASDEPEAPSIKPAFSKEQDWSRAQRSGILVTSVHLGDYIKENDVIGRINDPFNDAIFEVVKASRDGIVVGINRSPLITEGQNIFKIASFIDNNLVELNLEQWSELQEKLHEQ